MDKSTYQLVEWVDFFIEFEYLISLLKTSSKYDNRRKWYVNVKLRLFDFVIFKKKREAY